MCSVHRTSYNADTRECFCWSATAYYLLQLRHAQRYKDQIIDLGLGCVEERSAQIKSKKKLKLNRAKMKVKVNPFIKKTMKEKLQEAAMKVCMDTRAFVFVDRLSLKEDTIVMGVLRPLLCNPNIKRPLSKGVRSMLFTVCG